MFALRSWIVDRAPRLWVLWAASRPSQVLLVLVVYAIGVGMTTAETPLIAGSPSIGTPADVLAEGFLLRLIAGALALVSVAVSVHYANEYADVETDALTTPTPFSGGSGALVRTQLSPLVVRRAMICSVVISAVAIIAGVTTALLPVDAVAYLLAMLVGGLAYSLPPAALIRRGVGELVNVVLGGLLVPMYGIGVVATPTRFAHLAVLPFALVVGCSLLATHWPDRKADATVGKRTLVVRWSAGTIRRLYAGLAGAAVLVTIWLWRIGLVPEVVALSHLTVAPLLTWGWVVVTRQHNPAPSVLAMVLCAVTSLLAWWWVGIGP